jgi:hypothetical protein
MNGNRIFAFAVLLFAAVQGLTAQETGPVFRRLTWQPVEYVSGYEVTVEILTASNEWAEQFRKTSVTETFVDCPLFIGKYRFRVSAFDLLGRPGSVTDWVYFELRAREPAKAPEPPPAPEPVKAVEPAPVPEPVKAPEPAPEPEPVKAPEPVKTPEPAPAPLPAPPLPQEDERPWITVELFYAPCVTLPFSDFNEIYATEPFQAVGFTGNFSVYPFKAFALGLGLSPFWNFLSTEIHLKSRYTHVAGSHLFLVWQIQPAKKPVYINIRAGAGFTYFSSRFDFNEGLDITEQNAWNPSLNVGLSLQSRLSGPLFFDAGLEYFHIFSEDNLMLNYLRPRIGIGWRF